MSDKYRPSNGSEGDWFMAEFCDQCAKDDVDNNKLCDILTRTYAYDVDDKGYPKEWTYDEGIPVCTAFEEVKK